MCKKKREGKKEGRYEADLEDEIKEMVMVMKRHATWQADPPLPPECIVIYKGGRVCTRQAPCMAHFCVTFVSSHHPSPTSHASITTAVCRPHTQYVR